MEEKYQKVFKVSLFVYIWKALVCALICLILANIGGWAWYVIGVLIFALLGHFIDLYNNC